MWISLMISLFSSESDNVGLGRLDLHLLHVDLVEEGGQGVLRPVGRGGNEKPDEQLGHGGDQI
jgi:hypothetical protein